MEDFALDFVKAPTPGQDVDKSRINHFTGAYHQKRSVSAVDKTNRSFIDSNKVDQCVSPAQDVAQ